MRLIKTFHEEREAFAFFHFLQKKGIGCQFDIHTDNDWGSDAYGTYDFNLWIEEEDQINEAQKWLNLFENNPRDPIFNFPDSSKPQMNTHPPETPPKAIPPNEMKPSDRPKTRIASTWEKQPMGWVTRILLFTCTLLLLLTHFLVPSSKVPEQFRGLSLFTSPVEKALLYDYPQFYALINRFITLYGYEGLTQSHANDLTPEAQNLLKQIKQTPYWQGFYPLLIKEGIEGTKTEFAKTPRFEKIREGQVWRLFTPCLLHGDIFHLFFNMIWLMVLGKQIEARLRAPRYILFIVIIGVISNTAQYLMSGPNFLGFSGVLCGMLAFIWVRQKRAAWEGYQIDRLTLLFMLIYILGMAFVQLLSFFLEKSFDLAISPNIANMAHLSGGLIGFLLGRLNFFNWRHA